MVISLDGSEGRNVHGDIHEEEIRALFSNFFKWELIYSNFDMTFPILDTNKSKKAGIDFLYRLNEPFLEKSENHGVIVECKGREDMENFNVSKFSEDLYKLKVKIEKANLSHDVLEDQKIIDSNINYFKYGILCYRFNSFDINKFKNVLKKCEIRDRTRKNHFPVIFILSNDRISVFSHLKKHYSNLKYYYPHYLSNQNLNLRDNLSLFYMFSDIIMFEADGVKNILSFDEPSPTTFKLIREVCGRFNHNISEITFARANPFNKSIHREYNSQWVRDRGQDIKLQYLNNDMNCFEPLEEVFK
ncbi:hypothetical protein [Methanococcoides sp. NM1]|uniref:hypothetical protein n=1 Tax=Methanococcoides sp. NM1 TaxID=1201013 RepID=UPI0010825C46|nr:hypothetical protein [Methanococcoides sp. NM1]